MIEAPSSYWNICQISLTPGRSGYEYRSIPVAQMFLQTQFLESSQVMQKDTQSALLSLFQAKDATIAPIERAQAGLCLRCRVSSPILRACQKIASLFSGDKQFTYQDLLPFVLNDDGKALIILDDDGKTQLKLDDRGKATPATFKFFTVEVLRTFKADAASMSLNNWAFLQTRQHSELKNFLSEFGFQHLSDWALLNRARAKQFDLLSDRDRHLVTVFHQVYRRDRRQQQQVGKCADPSVAQLTEMNRLLADRGVVYSTPELLLKALKQAAQQLHQYDAWNSRNREPLETLNADTGHYEPRQDLPIAADDSWDTEEQEFLEFLHNQLKIALPTAIQQGVTAQLTQLEKSKKYAPFAACFLVGLQRYYCEGVSLRAIGPPLGMSSWDQTRRILNPGELLNRVRTLMVQHLLEQILRKAQAYGFTTTPPEPSYVKQVSEQVEALVDSEIFAAAAAEIKAGKNRSMDSLYAQQLKHYINQTIPVTQLT